MAEQLWVESLYVLGAAAWGEAGHADSAVEIKDFPFSPGIFVQVLSAAADMEAIATDDVVQNDQAYVKRQCKQPGRRVLFVLLGDACHTTTADLTKS